MNDHDSFKAECENEIQQQGDDARLRQLTLDWVLAAAEHKYSYHFEWLGRPIIQHPQDMVGLQQLIWTIQPDLIIETGIARGGSLIFSASILELIAICGGSKDARVLGIDIDIRAHNRQAIEKHPLSRRITMIEGSSVDSGTFERVRKEAEKHKKILVLLDSNHTHEHVLAELRLFAPLVSKGSFCVVYDTIVADMPEDAFPNRPWSKQLNPKSAVYAYLDELAGDPRNASDGNPLHFTIDKSLENLMLITVAPDGFLRRI